MNETAFEIPIGMAPCVVDSKGRDVMVGDVVMDSFCDRHTVTHISPIDANHAWIVDENGTGLVPHLTEKVPANE